MYLASRGGDEMKQKIVGSAAELRAGAQEQYVTANTFFLPAGGRNKKNLRQLLAIPLDFDVKKNGAIDVHELAMKIAGAGLPAASMMIRTPSGGIHAWWFLHRAPGTPRAVRLYESLQSSMAAATGADPAAVGSERLWRLPRVEDVIYSSSKKYRLKALRDWRDEHRPEDKPAGASAGRVYAASRGLLQHSAVQQLIRGVRQGQRDNACFALAAAHLAAGYSAAETEQLLLRWNELNTPPLPGAAIAKCVASAAKGLKKDYQHYYNAMRAKIREITGISIKYRPITPKKPRAERKRTHISEHEQDIIDLLQKRGGKLLLTQSRLAKMLNAPGRSIKAALAALAGSKAIIKIIISRGRRSVTVLISKIIQPWKKQIARPCAPEAAAAATGALGQIGTEGDKPPPCSRVTGSGLPAGLNCTARLCGVKGAGHEHILLASGIPPAPALRVPLTAAAPPVPGSQAGRLFKRQKKDVKP